MFQSCGTAGRAAVLVTPTESQIDAKVRSAPMMLASVSIRLKSSTKTSYVSTGPWRWRFASMYLSSSGIANRPSKNCKIFEPQLMIRSSHAAFNAELEYSQYPKAVAAATEVESLVLFYASRSEEHTSEL